MSPSGTYTKKSKSNISISRRKKVRQFLPALGWSLIILVLSILPGKSLPKIGWHFFFDLDKVAHAGVYFILALAIGWSLKKRDQLPWKVFAAIVLICAVYGIVLEGFQYGFLSDRFFEIPDIIANIIGSILGAIFVFVMFDKMKRL